MCASEHRYRSLFETATYGILFLDADTSQILDVNPFFIELTGGIYEQFVNRPIWEVEFFGEGTAIRDAFAAVKQKEYARYDDLPLRDSNGRRFEVEFICARDDGAPGRFVMCTICDITERKRAEQALQQSEIFFKESLRAGLIGSFKADFVKGSWESSEMLDTIFGIDKNYDRSIPGLMNMLHPDDREEIARYLQEDVIGKHKPFDKEYRIVRKSDGEPRWVYCHGMASFEDGNATYLIGTIQDITERKRIEDALAQRASELAQANRDLESFSYSLSHDLRTPLRAIEGFSTILEEDYAGVLDTEGLRYLDRIKNSTDKMVALIDDMLILGKIAVQEINITLIDLSEIVDSVVNELHQAEPQRTVDIYIAPALKAYADGGLMKIVLSNLLGNAWKFSGKRPDAKIEFGSTEIAGEKVYYVKDNGVGFDMSRAQKLFEPFHRFHLDCDFSGAGMGLAIVNKIIRRHGGTIRGESEVDKGATFYFTLPGDRGSMGRTE